MTHQAWLQLAVFLTVLLAMAWPLARAIDAVMAGRFAPGQRLETPLWRLAGVRPERETGWFRYALGLLAFNALGMFVVYALQRVQHVMPLNPQAFGAVTPDSAFNTAISFMSNTNWQGYGGETTMSYLTQMLGLTVQNFLSAATGIVVVIALVRGFSRHSAQAIGNVWVDLTRVTLWVLLPLSLVLAVFLAGQGVIQNFSPYSHRHRGGHRPGARLLASLGTGHRQRVGGSHPRHLVGAAAVVAGAGGVLRRPGGDSKLLALHRGEDAGDRELGNQCPGQ